jgi:XTP/dITP diphosphohydrolase
MKNLLIATHNPAKLQEFRQKLGAFAQHIVSLDDLGITYDVPETGKTFGENALLKARTYANIANMPALADDGGLEIIALNNWPGVYSSRFAGEGATEEQKIAALIERINQLPDNKRQARFVGAVAIAWPDGTEKLYEATIDGFVITQMRGKRLKGFPYRTLFILPEYNKTLAELDELNIPYESHRVKALNALVADLSKI